MIPSVTLSNTPLNNLLLNSYSENHTGRVNILYVFNMHANFHINWILFTILFNSIHKLIFMHYFKL